MIYSLEAKGRLRRGGTWLYWQKIVGPMAVATIRFGEIGQCAPNAANPGNRQLALCDFLLKCLHVQRLSARQSCFSISDSQSDSAYRWTMYLPMSVRPSDSVAIEHQMDVALPPQAHIL